MNHPTLCFLSYNRPEFLHRAITGAIAGADRPIEIIVHDDGSTDERVVPLLRQMQVAGQISTLILNPPGHNEGQGIALNRMFRLATGRTIFKLDQDVTFNPGWLADAMEILDGNDLPERDEPVIGLLGLLHYHADPVDTAKCKLADWEDWEEHTHILGSAFAVPTGIWRLLGPFDERSTAFAEDWAFQQKVTAQEGMACALPAGRNLVENPSMGPGPSTIVSAAPDGEIVVTKIREEPYLVVPPSASVSGAGSETERTA